MFHIKLLVAWATVITIPFASGAIINCDFKNYGTYECYAKTIDNIATQNEAITITGTHLQGLGDIDLKKVSFTQQVVNYVPTQMFSIFPSISTFVIEDSALHTLTTDAFIGCPNLDAIYLNRNPFSNVPAGFAETCIILTYIDFSQNEIQIIDKDAFKGLTLLSTINFSVNNISYIHPDTFKKTQASSIRLDSNQITTLHPDTFSGLSQLTYIMLSNNKLEYLPKLNFSGSENLSLLQLRNNLIASIDPEFSFPPNSEQTWWTLGLQDNTCVNEKFHEQNTYALDKVPLCYTLTTTTQAATTTTQAATTTTQAATTTTQAASTTTDVIITTTDAITTTTDVITTMTDAITTTTQAATTMTDVIITAVNTTSEEGTCQSDGVCRYFLDHKKRYTCVLENVAYTLSSISGIHDHDCGDFDVVSLYFLNSQLVKIPSIIFKKFPNLNFLSVSETGLTVLNEDTFEECGILKELDASKNQIAHITMSSLLKCNSLQWLDLTGNNDLEEMTPEFFQSHPNLQHVILNRIVPILP